MLAQLQRPQADRRHTWTYSYAPAGRQAAYEPHGSRSGGARRRPIVIAWRNRERRMVRGLRRGIRSSVDRRSKSGIDGDDDDTDRPQPDSPPLFLALVGLLLSYRRAGWKRTKPVSVQKNKKALRARRARKGECSSGPRDHVLAACSLLLLLRSRGTASRPVLGKRP